MKLLYQIYLVGYDRNKRKEDKAMLEKVNPYLKEELSREAAAHLCGCRCANDSGTVGAAIQVALNSNSCYAYCVSTSNGNANYTAAYGDKKWS